MRIYIRNPLSDQEVNQEVVNKYSRSGQEPKWKNAHVETLEKPGRGRPMILLPEQPQVPVAPIRGLGEGGAAPYFLGGVPATPFPGTPHHQNNCLNDLFLFVADTRLGSRRLAYGVCGHLGPGYMCSMDWKTCSFMRMRHVPVHGTLSGGGGDS